MKKPSTRSVLSACVFSSMSRLVRPEGDSIPFAYRCVGLLQQKVKRMSHLAVNIPGDMQIENVFITKTRVGWFHTIQRVIVHISVPSEEVSNWKGCWLVPSFPRVTTEPFKKGQQVVDFELPFFERKLAGMSLLDPNCTALQEIGFQVVEEN